MAIITGAAIGTAEATITPAKSSTTTKFTSPTITCTRDDLPVRAILDIVHQTRDIPGLVTLLSRCLIREPSRLTTVLVDIIVRATAQFRQRGLTTPRPRSRMRLTIQT